MASGTPVGNMIIKVDLDAVGVEKSMTGLQRQLKSSNKAMGAQLSAFGRGEKSAKKYGVLIEGLSNRHRIQARMVEEARKKYADMSSTYGENSVKAQQAAQNLNEQIARYQETGRELDNVTAEFQEFQRVQEIQNKGWYKAADSLDKYGGKLKSAGKSMDQAGQTMTRKVTLPLAAVGGIATKVGSDFEAGMSKVGAVSGASAKDMDKLEKKAREMGATTIFSAKEASDAFYYMSLAGWDAQQSMDGIAGVMDLAAASGEDLALVSDIVTDGLTAFGLEAKDAGRMADVLASASANANTDVNGLGNAFKYAAPVAGALGYSIEDTSKAIGLMSNAGIKGEKAGTALRTMMTNLASPTKNMKKQMDKLGISLTDSNGEMKSLDTIMLDLRKSFKHLDKDQQAAAASTIFGKEAMSGALAIVNASESDYKKLSKAIAESEGSAKKMADVMQDNLQGSLKELQSMAEDLFITMYKNLKPSIESVVDSAKDLTQWFANLSPETQKNIVQFGLLAAAAGPVLSVTGKLTFGVGALMQGVGGLTKAIGLSKGVGLLGSMSMLGPGAVAGVAIAGAVGLGAAIYKTQKRADKATESKLELAEATLESAQANLENTESVRKDIEATGDLIEGTTAYIEKTDDLISKYDTLTNKSKLSRDEFSEFLGVQTELSLVKSPERLDELNARMDELQSKSGLSKDEMAQLVEVNKQIIETVPGSTAVTNEYGDAVAGTADKVKNLRNEELERMRTDVYNKLSDDVRSVNGALDRQKEVTGEIFELQDKVSHAETIIKGHKEEVSAIDNDILSKSSERKSLQDQIAEASGLEKMQLTSQLKELDKNIAGQVTKKRQLENNLGVHKEELEVNKKSLESLQKEEESITATIDANLRNKDLLVESLASQYDINIEKGNEIKSINEAIKAREKEVSKLEDIIKKEGDADGKIKAKIESLKKGNGELEKEKTNLKNIVDTVNEQTRKYDGVAEAKKKVNAEGEKQKANGKENVKLTDLWNKAVKNLNSEVDKGTGKQKKQGDQIGNNNKKTDEGIKKEKERTKEAGKDVDKNVKVKDNGTTDKINKKAAEPKNKDVNLKAKGAADVNRKATEPKNKNVTLKAVGTAALNRVASSPVTKVVNFVGKGMKKLKFWAKGTPPQGHSGGDAVMGERGRELVKLPSGETFLTPQQATFYPNLPKGTHVIPNHKTERLLRGTSHYADGTSGWKDLFSTENLRSSELMKLLSLNSPTKKMSVSRRNNGLEDLIKQTIKQNEYLQKMVDLLMVLTDKELETIIAFEPLYGALKKRMNQDKHSQFKQRRR